MIRSAGMASDSTSRRSTCVARSEDSSQLVAYLPEPDTGRVLACPSMDTCSEMPRSVGERVSITRWDVGVSCADSGPKKTSWATRPMIRPRSVIL